MDAFCHRLVRVSDSLEALFSHFYTWLLLCLQKMSNFHFSLNIVKLEKQRCCLMVTWPHSAHVQSSPGKPGLSYIVSQSQCFVLDNDNGIKARNAGWSRRSTSLADTAWNDIFRSVAINAAVESGKCTNACVTCCFLGAPRCPSSRRSRPTGTSWACTRWAHLLRPSPASGSSVGCERNLEQRLRKSGCS